MPVEPPKAKTAGYTAQDEVLRQHVLERLADQMHAKKGDPTSYLGVHDSVTVDGKRYGGGNRRMDAIAEKLHDASDLRAQAGKKRLDISHKPHCPLLPGLLGPRVRFLALRYGWVTISAGAPART